MSMVYQLNKYEKVQFKHLIYWYLFNMSYFYNWVRSLEGTSWRKYIFFRYLDNHVYLFHPQRIHNFCLRMNKMVYQSIQYYRCLCKRWAWLSKQTLWQNVMEYPLYAVVTAHFSSFYFKEIVLNSAQMIFFFLNLQYLFILFYF